MMQGFSAGNIYGRFVRAHNASKNITAKADKSPVTGLVTHSWLDFNRTHPKQASDPASNKIMGSGTDLPPSNP